VSGIIYHWIIPEQTKDNTPTISLGLQDVTWQFVTV